MSLGEGARQLCAALLLTGRQRLELAALDVEDELLRAGSQLAALQAIAGLATLSLAALAAAFVVAMWPVAPVASLLAIGLLFAAAAFEVARRLLRSTRERPRLLQATLQELGRDAELFSAQPR